MGISRRDFIKVAGAAGIGGMLLGCNLLPGNRSASIVPAVASDGAFTVVALPDTQYYSSTYPDNYLAQTQWIVDNKDRLNIVFVAHLGDVVDAGYDSAQWANAQRAMDRLIGVLPFGMVCGNHDLYLSPAEDSPNHRFVELFGPESRYFKGNSWYGGASPSGFSSWQKITVSGRDLMFLNLDDGAKREELAWGQQVLDRNLGTLTIVVTHEYLNQFSQRHGQAYLHESGRESGQQMWDQLVRCNPQVFMVLCGHTHGQARLISWNDANLPVHELLSDYQMLANGGNGFMRIMTFDPANRLVNVRTWSPTLKRDLGIFDCPGEGAFTLKCDLQARLAQLGGDKTRHAAGPSYRSAREPAAAMA